MPGTDKDHFSRKQQKRDDDRGGEHRARSPQKGGQIGIDASAQRSKADRSASAKKAAETRKPVQDRDASE